MITLRTSCKPQRLAGFPRLLLGRSVVCCEFLVLFQLIAQTLAAEPMPGYTIPVVDISSDTNRQVIVDREPGQYLGHPTTVLLEDGKTILIVYPKGHGRGAIVTTTYGHWMKEEPPYIMSVRFRLSELDTKLKSNLSKLGQGKQSVDRPTVP